MTVDPGVLTGLAVLALELLVLVAVGFAVARVALRENDDLAALAQGLVIGPALWGLAVNFILHVVPGLAGALVGWMLILSLGAIVARRSPEKLRVQPRTLAGFAGATLAVFWVTLAARQLMKVPDSDLHLGLAASIRAGGWPPVLPWNPDLPAYYHHGVDLLTGLLAPSTGPGPVLATELIGAYVWTSFAMIVVTALRQRSDWRSAFLLAPLLLTAGAWTLTGQLNEVPNILSIPVPTDMHTAGLRGSLASLYWPETTTRWHSELDGAPANIWKPAFVLGYALAFVVLWQAAADRRRTWSGAATLAGLIGFLGIVSAEVALLTLGLWAVLDSLWIAARLRVGDWAPGVLPRTAGPLAAALMLGAGGGTLTALLLGEPRADFSIGWIDDPFAREAFGGHERVHGRIGLLGVGALSAALLAVALGWRDRLTMTLAAGTLPLMAAALMVEYPTAPHDVTRFDGHARNFALLALLLALAGHLPGLRPRRRLAAGAVLAALVVWPTAALPVRTIGQGVSRGVALTNPEPGPSASVSSAYDLRRFAIIDRISPEVIRHIRERTEADTRILTPHPAELSIATGRPNGMGFAGHMHLIPMRGTAYDDAVRYLEPGPLGRRGFAYVHAPDAWTARLPYHAQRWLADSTLFEPVVRTASDALYRVLPAFGDLEGAYSAATFEALRQAVPDSTGVYLAPNLAPRAAARLAAALPQEQRLGSLDQGNVHWMSVIPTNPLDSRTPDLIALPARMAPAALNPTARQPVWWNDDVSVYAPTGAMSPLIDPPSPQFSIQLSDVRIADGRIGFTAAFTDRAADRWQGQDWVVVETDDSPWRIPYRFDTVSYTSVFVRWFDGQVQPVPDTEVHNYTFLYEFEPRTGVLAVWDGSRYSTLSSPQPQLRAGNWTLAARPNVNREEVGLIPVLHFALTDDGDFAYKVYEGSLDARLVR